MAALIPLLIKGMLAEKAMDKLGVPEEVREAASFASNPKRFIGSRLADKAIKKALEPKLEEIEEKEEKDTYNPDTDSFAYRGGGKVKSASKRGDGCCKRGKTRGKMY